jgi:DNA-binding transcriptional LysR family regulator
LIRHALNMAFASVQHNTHNRRVMPAKKQDLANARWDDVRLFLAVHRYGTFGQAAARLGLDTSTVSRRLAAFEEALGVQLFERTRDGVVATRAGDLAVPAAEAMEAALGQLGRVASARETDAEGVVRISVAPGMAEVFVAPALVRLRAKHPRLRIELDASVRAIDLTRHEADLALRSIQPRGAELVMTRLTTARWVAAGSPAFVAGSGRVRAWDQVPWIAWDQDLASFEPARWLARHVPAADVALRTSHFGAQLAAAAAGLGVALVPEPYLPVRGLTELRYAAALGRDAEAWPNDSLWLVGHRALRDIPRVAAVWEFVIGEWRTLGRGSAG